MTKDAAQRSMRTFYEVVSFSQFLLKHTMQSPFPQQVSVATLSQCPILTFLILVYRLSENEKMNVRHVEHYARQPDSSWRFVEYSRPEDDFEIRTIACRLKLEDIYEKIDIL
jgi:hypothetical protein